MTRRATFLTPHQFALLVDWGEHLYRMFGSVPYLVGSSLERVDYRDIDVRVMLPDKRFEKLANLLRLHRLNLAVTMWGCAVTGMLIDFQVQSMTEANGEYGERPRNPLVQRDAA